jgi:mannose-1-phosphate guanylyltransferase
MDIGQPKDYLSGTITYLNSQPKSRFVDKTEFIYDCVLKHESAIIEEGAVVGPNVVIGKGVVVKKGARIKNSVILNDSLIDGYAYIEGSIIGWKNKVGKWVRISGLTISGEDVTFNNEVYVNSSTILPNLTVKTDIEKGSVIIC